MEYSREVGLLKISKVPADISLSELSSLVEHVLATYDNDAAELQAIYRVKGVDYTCTFTDPNLVARSRSVKAYAPMWVKAFGGAEDEYDYTFELWGIS